MPDCFLYQSRPIDRQTDARADGRTNTQTDNQTETSQPTNQPTHQPTKDDNIAFAVRQMWWIKMMMMMQLIANMQCDAIITRSFFSPIARGGSSVTSVHGVPLVNSEFMLYRCHRSCVQCHDMLDRVIMTPGPSFIKPDQLDPWSNKKRSVVHNFVPTVTKFCVMWEGLSFPHDTKFGNCRGEIVDRRVIFIWSMIHGSSWYGLINLGPDAFDTDI